MRTSLCETLAEGDERGLFPCILRRIREDVFIEGILPFLPRKDVIRNVSCVSRAYRGAAVQSDGWLSSHVVASMEMGTLDTLVVSDGPWRRVVDRSASTLLEVRTFDLQVAEERRVLAFCAAFGSWNSKLLRVSVANPQADQALFFELAGRCSVDIVRVDRLCRGTFVRVYAVSCIATGLCALGVGATWATSSVTAAFAAGATPGLIVMLVVAFLGPTVVATMDTRVAFEGFAVIIPAANLFFGSVCLTGGLYLAAYCCPAVIAAVLPPVAAGLPCGVCVGFIFMKDPARTAWLRMFFVLTFLLLTSTGAGFGLALRLHYALYGLLAVAGVTAFIALVSILPLGIEAHKVVAGKPVFGTWWTPRVFRLVFFGLIAAELLAGALGIWVAHAAFGGLMLGLAGASLVFVCASGPILSVLGMQALRVDSDDRWVKAAVSSTEPISTIHLPV